LASLVHTDHRYHVFAHRALEIVFCLFYHFPQPLLIRIVYIAGRHTQFNRTLYTEILVIKSKSAYIRRAKRTTNKNMSKSEEKEKGDKEKWYPGKFIKERRKSTMSSTSDGSLNGSKSQRSPIVGGSVPSKTVGTVIVKIMGAKYMSATRPSFEVCQNSPYIYMCK
jgi:hypothetical protein